MVVRWLQGVGGVAGYDVNELVLFTDMPPSVALRFLMWRTYLVVSDKYYCYITTSCFSIKPCIRPMNLLRY
jgi:hypothetical protein